MLPYMHLFSICYDISSIPEIFVDNEEELKKMEQIFEKVAEHYG